MFCSKCGYKLNDHDIFCAKCGSQIKLANEVMNSPNATEPKYNELDNKALRIYLGDVLAMECIKKQYMQKLQKINNTLANVSGNFVCKCYFVPKNERTHWDIHSCFKDEVYFTFVYTQDRYYVISQDYGYTLTPWIRPLSGRLTKIRQDELLDIEDNFDYLMSDKPWKALTHDYTGPFQRKKAFKEIKPSFIKYYEDFKKVANCEMMDNRNKRAVAERAKTEITREIKEAERILQKLYNVNIIPSQFRNNIYAIYYLYDFICTSQQSLSTAMLHFDLKEIQNRLNTIIEQQQDIIINQAKLMSQNQSLLQQNQQQLRYLANIESNTSRAATYSEIAACNAEACAWIGVANYIKNS